MLRFFYSYLSWALEAGLPDESSNSIPMLDASMPRNGDPSTTYQTGTGLNRLPGWSIAVLSGRRIRDDSGLGPPLITRRSPWLASTVQSQAMHVVFRLPYIWIERFTLSEEYLRSSS
jgi:hypothetical protein